MDREAVIEALDKAIARAGLNALTAAMEKPPYVSMQPDAKRQEVSSKSDALRKSLGNLVPPDYADDVTAAAYLFTYQTSHIGLAWAMIRDMTQNRLDSNLLLTDSGKLHVIDFGCGALAMQFGVALAVAEAIENGEQIDMVTIDGIDTSKQMQDMGMSVWQEFSKAVDSGLRLEALSRACRLIEYNCHDNYRSVQQIPDAEVWLSAMHAVYQSNKDEIKRVFGHFRKNATPTAVFATCWGTEHNTANVEIVRSAWPNRAGEFQSREIYLPVGGQYPISFPFGTTEPSAHNMSRIAYERGVLSLPRDLFWRPSDAAILTWTRRDTGQLQPAGEPQKRSLWRRFLDWLSG